MSDFCVIAAMDKIINIIIFNENVEGSFNEWNGMYLELRMMLHHVYEFLRNVRRSLFCPIPAAFSGIIYDTRSTR
jgi:hypothetical protein